MRIAFTLAGLGRSLHLYAGSSVEKDETVVDRAVAAAEQTGAGTGLWVDFDGQDDAGELKKYPLRQPSRFGFDPTGGRHV